MNKLIGSLSLMAISGAAFAHEGHGAPGLFHHFEQMAPAIILVAVVAGIIWKMKVANCGEFNERFENRSW